MCLQTELLKWQTSKDPLRTHNLNCILRYFSCKMDCCKISFVYAALLLLFVHLSMGDITDGIPLQTTNLPSSRIYLDENATDSSQRTTGGDHLKAECSCGDKGTCHFEGEIKVCKCEQGYDEMNGICYVCNCGPNGNCSFERVAEFSRRKCDCSNGYEVFGGSCKACFCGINGNCTFDYRGRNVCKCEFGYGPRSGTCTPCGCVPDMECTFDRTTQRCHCPKGYEDVQGLCKDIDECLDSNVCPSTSKCVNMLGSYDCNCKEGFEEPPGNFNPERDECKDIDECVTLVTPCLYESTECVNTFGSYRCDCKPGYTPLITPLDQDGKPWYNDCIEDTSGSKNIAIAVGCVCGAIIIALLILVQYKERKKWR